MSTQVQRDMHRAFRQAAWQGLLAAQRQASSSFDAARVAFNGHSNGTWASGHSNGTGGESFARQVRRALNATIGVAAGSSDPAAVRKAAIKTFPLLADGRLPDAPNRWTMTPIVGVEGVVLDLPQRTLKAEVTGRVDELRTGVATLAGFGNGEAAAAAARIHPILDTLVVAASRPGGADIGALETALNTLGSGDSGALGELVAEGLSDEIAVTERVTTLAGRLTRTATSIDRAVAAYVGDRPGSFSYRLNGIARAADTIESQASKLLEAIDDRAVGNRSVGGSLLDGCDDDSSADSDDIAGMDITDEVPDGPFGTWMSSLNQWASGVERSVGTLTSADLADLRLHADRLFAETTAVGVVASADAYAGFVDPYLAAFLNEEVSRVRLADLAYQLGSLADLAELVDPSEASQA